MSTFGVGLLQGLNLAWAQRMKQQQEEQELAMRKEDLKLRQQILKGQEAMQQLTSTKTFLDLQQMLQQREQEGTARGIIAPAMQELNSPQPSAAPLPPVAPPQAPEGMPPPMPVAPPTAPPVQPQGRPPLPVPGPAQPGGAAPKGDVEAALRLYGREQAPAAELAEVNRRIAQVEATEQRIRGSLTDRGILPEDIKGGRGALEELAKRRDDLTKRRSELERQQAEARKEATAARKEQMPQWPLEFEGWFQNMYQMRPQEAWGTPQGKALLKQGEQRFKEEEQTRKGEQLARQGESAARITQQAMQDRSLDEAMKGDAGKYIDMQTGLPIPAGLRYGDVLPQLGTRVKRLTDEEYKPYTLTMKTVPVLNSLRQQLERVYGPNGIFANLKPEERIAAAGRGGWARLTQTNPELVVLTRGIKSNVDLLRRNFQGQVGTQTEGDAQRGLGALPQVDGIPDSQDVAYETFNTLTTAINDALRNILGNPLYQHPELKPLVVVTPLSEEQMRRLERIR